MPTSGTNIELIVGITTGLLLSFGIAAGITAYVSDPGHVPLRAHLNAGASNQMITWNDPNGGMVYTQDFDALKLFIKQQDAENLQFRLSLSPRLSSPGNGVREDRTENSFEIELRPAVTEPISIE